MKKLLFATALVASAAAFADGPLNAISFEGYSADATFTNGTAEKDEEGVIKSEAAYGYFFFEGDADASSVKAFGNGEGQVAAPQIRRPLCFASASPNANYLELSTEGGILWRSINTLNSYTGETTTYSNGAPVAVAADGIYLDTLVQFTPTEDGGAPELDAADKLAIWLNVDSNQQTNLMVKAGLYDDEGTPVVGGDTFVITGKTVVASEWYRLTVKAVDDILPANESFKIPGFQIFIDSVPMAATMAPIPATFVGALRQAEMMTAEQEAAINSGVYLPSLVAGTPNVASTLQSVGFKGSGALDDIVWTTEDPFAGGAQPEGYVVDLNGSNVAITLTDAQLAVMAEAGVSTNSVAAVNAALDLEIGGEGATGVKAWEAAILGLAPTVAGLQEFKIDSVTIGADGKVTIEMADGVTLATGQGIDITLKVIGSNDLSTWDTTNPLATVTNSLEIPDITPANGETKKFYKVVVEFAASSAQN